MLQLVNLVSMPTVRIIVLFLVICTLICVHICKLRTYIATFRSENLQFIYMSLAWILCNSIKLYISNYLHVRMLDSRNFRAILLNSHIIHPLNSTSHMVLINHHPIVSGQDYVLCLGESQEEWVRPHTDRQTDWSPGM